MIVVKKNGYLEYRNIKFRCSLGKAGIHKKIKEGDNITPRGTYKILSIYYRQDRIKKIKCQIKKIKITKKIGWCDDLNSKYYNKQIKLPSKLNHEILYRKDDIYDIVCIINYNINPILKGRGSAIFLHIAKKKYQKTKGCIALKKNDLIKLLTLIKKNTKIKIG
jgi:L,D-peptidoglycan transpeptidase YkuD (ErfK/YbiS/YcfS/YnhG family)